MDTIISSEDVTQNVSKFYTNLEKFFDLIKSIVVLLRSKGYQVPGPEVIEVGKQISVSYKNDVANSYRTPIAMFLRLNKHHSTLTNRDIDFFEKNLNSIFDLPDMLSGLATSIVKCKKKSTEDGDETLDIPIKSINTMFVATEALATNGIKILYALADPSGYKIDDELGYRVYTWRNDPKEIFSYMKSVDQEKLGVDSFDLSHALYVWKVKDLPDPK